MEMTRRYHSTLDGGPTNTVHSSVPQTIARMVITFPRLTNQECKSSHCLRLCLVTKLSLLAIPRRCLLAAVKMVIDDDKYYAWKGEPNPARLAEIKADMDVAKVVGLRILDTLKITTAHLDEMFNKNIGPEYTDPGLEMIRPQDLEGVYAAGEVDLTAEKRLVIKIPGNGRGKAKS